MSRPKSHNWSLKQEPETHEVELAGLGVGCRDVNGRRTLRFAYRISLAAIARLGIGQECLKAELPCHDFQVTDEVEESQIHMDRWVPMVDQFLGESGPANPILRMRRVEDACRCRLLTSWQGEGMPRTIAIRRDSLELSPPGKLRPKWDFDIIISDQFAPGTCLLSVRDLRNCGILVRQGKMTAFFGYGRDRDDRLITPSWGRTSPPPTILPLRRRT